MKKLVLLVIMISFLCLNGGCLKNGESKKDSANEEKITYVSDSSTTFEDLEELKAIQEEIAKEFPLSPDVLDKRATNPSSVQIIAAMKAAGIKYNIPYEVLYGIGMCESNLRQFKSDGNPLISGDNGYGIMQVTPWAVSQTFDIESLKWNYQYNIEAGAQVILSKWKYAIGRNPIGNCDPKVLENWYITIWAYNGYSTINNPNEYIYGPRTWNNGYITWTRTAPYQVDVIKAIKNNLGITITPIPGSQLPSTGIPASGKTFATPLPMHYTSNVGTVAKGTVTITVADTLKTNEAFTISGTATTGITTVKGYIDGVALAAGDVAVVNGKYSFSAMLTKSGTRVIKIVGTGSAAGTVEKTVTVTDGTAVPVVEKVTLDVADTLLTDTVYTISGTATSGITKIKGYIDDVLFLNGDVAVVNGKYSFTAAVNKTGSRVIKIVGTGTTTVTVTKNVTVKDNAAVTVTCPAEMTTNTIYTISGTATTGITRVKGYVDDTLLLNGDVAVVDGKYSFTAAFSKTGSRVIKIVGTGTSTVTATKNVTVKDNAAVTVTCPAEMTTNTVYTISGTATTGITRVKGYVDDTLLLNGDVAVVNGKYSFTAAFSKTGSRVIKIVGTGTSTVTATKNVTVNGSAGVTINCSSAMTTYTTYTISGTVTAGITRVKGYIDNTLFINGDVAVVNGSYSFTMQLSATGSRVIKVVGTGSSTVTATKNVTVTGTASSSTGAKYAAYYTNNYSAIITETKKFWNQAYGCAATCSTSLKMYGFSVRQVLVTNDVESQLINLRWKKVTDLTALQPGDVMFADKADSNVAGTWCHVYVFVRYADSAKNFAIINDNNGKNITRNLYSGAGQYSKTILGYRAP